jgi:hypothetical protein
MSQVWVTIPTGQRGDRARETVVNWKRAGFKVAAYVWDDQTYDAVNLLVDKIWRGERASFAKLQNFMAANLEGWDGLICAADDLWPKYGTELIGDLVRDNQGKVIWANDGLFNMQPTHPIITRAWYDKHNGRIFSEVFEHNFCDTDLAVRTANAGELVRCEDVSFDHRHHFKTRQKDAVYALGQKSFKRDAQWFATMHGDIDLNKLLWSVPKIHVACPVRECETEEDMIHRRSFILLVLSAIFAKWSSAFNFLARSKHNKFDSARPFNGPTMYKMLKGNSFLAKNCRFKIKRNFSVEIKECVPKKYWPNIRYVLDLWPDNDDGRYVGIVWQYLPDDWAGPTTVALANGVRFVTMEADAAKVGTAVMV